MSFALRSSAFHEDESIPGKYTCDGANVSIPLMWTDPPEGTNGFALVMDDPDAPSGTWVHWVVFDLPADIRQLAEARSSQKIANDYMTQGINDFGKVGYGGPCPPHGPAHRYFFKLYALDRLTGLQPGATKQELLRAIKGHTLGQVSLVGIYKR